MAASETVRAGQEQAPSEAEIDVCTADRNVTYMKMKMEGPSEFITYELWGETATELRETFEHFTLDKVKNDDDLLMAALDNFGLRFKIKNGFEIAGGASGVPPHKCQEPPRTTPLPELYVGQVDACIADESRTVSVIYGIVTGPSVEFRKTLTDAIEKTISTYRGDMSSGEGLKDVLTDSILAVEKRLGGETFFYFAPSGALQEGCKPQKLAM